MIVAGLVRGWPVLGAADLAFLAAMAAVCLGALAWRRFHPGSFARYRELPAVAFRLAVAASPAAWKITQQSLNGAVPYTGGSGLRDTAAFGLVVLFSSFSATGSVMVSRRHLAVDCMHGRTELESQPCR